MADITDSFWANASGRFYVDSTCIDCDMCRELAPSFFKRHDGEGQTHVHQQPTTADEIQQCREALDLCPSNSIGDSEDS